MFSASGEPVSKPRAQFCVVLTSTGVVYPPEKTAWTWVYASRKSLSFNQRLRWVFKIQVLQEKPCSEGEITTQALQALQALRV